MQEMKMSVSPIVQKDGKKYIYVVFSEETRSAEGRLPDCKLISNQGFSEEEVKDLERYLQQEKNTIIEMAKGVSAMNAFLKKQ